MNQEHQARHQREEKLLAAKLFAIEEESKLRDEYFQKKIRNSKVKKQLSSEERVPTESVKPVVVEAGSVEGRPENWFNEEGW